MDIFSELGTFRTLGKKTNLESKSGRVIAQKEWTESHNHVSGGGQYSSPTITTTTTEKGETYLLDHAGKEFMWRMTNVSGIRAGHVLTCFWPFETSHKKHTAYWGMYNHNLEKLEFWWPRITDGLAPSRLKFWASTIILTSIATYAGWSVEQLTSDLALAAIVSFPSILLILSIIFKLLGFSRRMIFKARYEKKIRTLFEKHSKSIEHQLSDQVFL